MIFAGLVLAAANFLVVLDTTIANVSVSNISGALAVSPSQGTWVITSYAVAEAVVVPLTGWLSARFGAVKVFVLGMVGFGFFSFLCGLAPSLSLLVLFRVLQGACGGPLMPLSQAIMKSTWPAPEGHQSTRQWLTRSVWVLPPSGLSRMNEFSPVIRTSLGSTGEVMSFSLPDHGSE